MCSRPSKIYVCVLQRSSYTTLGYSRAILRRHTRSPNHNTVANPLMDVKSKENPLEHPTAFALAQNIVDSKACTKEFLKNALPTNRLFAISSGKLIYGYFYHRHYPRTLPQRLSRGHIGSHAQKVPAIKKQLEHPHPQRCQWAVVPAQKSPSAPTPYR